MKERTIITTYRLKTKTRHSCSLCGLEIQDGEKVKMQGHKFNWTFTHVSCLPVETTKEVETIEEMPIIEEKEKETMTKETLEAMSVAELRKLAREKGCKGTAVLTLSKAELVDCILTGKIPAKQENTNNGKGSDDLATIIANAIQDKVSARVNMEDVEAMIDMKIEEMASKIKFPVFRIEVENKETKEIKDIGIQHKDFQKILKLAQRRFNVLLCGPSGAGKTHLAGALGEALGLQYFAMSVCQQTSKSDLFGYMAANGQYVTSLLRIAYENGGVFMLDEIDCGNANVLALLNAALSNGYCSFPDGMVKRHPNFICLAGANTFGKGSDRLFVGRNPLDAATLNRFKVRNFDYDEDMERTITRAKIETGHEVESEKWIERVITIRRAVEKLKERIVVSSRAIYDGVLFVADGFSFDEIEDMTIFQGCNIEVKNRILAMTKDLENIKKAV